MSSPDLCFVSPPGGSVFMDELLEVVADAVRRAGGSARTVTGAYPEPTAETVYVVVPHEYFVVTPPALRPPAALLRRTIGFGVEHPGTRTFERTAEIMPSLGAAVDINADSVAEFRRAGLTARPFQLGYSPLWDAWGGDELAERPVDITYLGTAERRRSVLLAAYWRDLEHLRCQLLTPPHEPMRGRRVDFLPGRDKLAHLARSRLLLNLHRERSLAAEWVRFLEAMCNGCVVVTEPCSDLEPLVAGTHLVVARPAALGAVAAALAEQPERERKIRRAAYDFVRTELDMRRSATMLLEVAADLLDGGTAPVRWRPSGRLAAPDRDAEPPLAVDTPAFDPTLAAALARVTHRPAPPRLDTPVSKRGAEPTTDGTAVDVLIVQRPGEPDPGRLATDLARGAVPPGQVLVYADGTANDGTAARRGWLYTAAPAGCGPARNALLERASAPWLLVLDAGMRASPYLVQRLLAATDRADVVWCPVGDPVAGLVNALPPERRRLAALPYLGSGYLVRRDVLVAVGGWPADPLVDGLADHAFWLMVAAADLRAELVQQVLLTRVCPAEPREHGKRPVDTDPDAAWLEMHAYVMRAATAAIG